MRYATISLVALLALTLVSTSAQQTGATGCPVAPTKKGETVTVRGKIVEGPHDMLLSVPGCDDALVLAYAGEEDTGVPGAQLRRDKNLKRFQTYTSATYKGKGTDICMQCSKYEVEATLTGRLDVATLPEGATKDPLGFARDANGKVLGKVGWGHPVPIYKYRLVIESVANVVARKLPKPTTPTTGGGLGAGVFHENGHAAGAEQEP